MSVVGDLSRRPAACCEEGGSRVLFYFSVVLWMAVILIPLVLLFGSGVVVAWRGGYEGLESSCVLRSFALAAAVAAAAVVLGYVPGKVLGGCRRGFEAWLLVLLMPVVLPRYVHYYAWMLVLSPTSKLGAYLATRMAVARAVHTVVCCAVLVLWLWPLAALVLAGGWRSTDRGVWDSALLEAGRLRRFWSVVFPILRRWLLLAFGVCFVLALSEFATFHLGGVRTMGTELAVLYQQSGSEAVVATAAWPVVVAAALIAVALTTTSKKWQMREVVSEAVESRRWGGWLVVAVLFAVSFLVPVGLLVGNVRDARPFGQFITLHYDGLLWSLVVAGAAAVTAVVIAFAAVGPEAPGRRGAGMSGRLGRIGFSVVRFTVFVAALVPGSVVAVALLKMLGWVGPELLRQSWYVVSAGQATRFAGVVVILLILGRAGRRRQMLEMAVLDGASRRQRWWYVWWPQSWPILLCSVLLVGMLSVTELSATMVLLPAGLPNFAQRLLNQMHYLREQDVIACCVVLTVVFLLLISGVVVLLRLGRLYRGVAAAVVLSAMVVGGGCDDSASTISPPAFVRGYFGRTGRGRCEFIYPRAIDVAADGTLFVVDKTGRIQHLADDGRFLGEMRMPLTAAGKPTGLSVGDDGRVYVADTHYHRVVVFSADGQIVETFGEYGQGLGCFIYPTDVAFAGDGRIYVSEYGGNDRVSIFDKQRRFLRSFGSYGSERGQFARPSALCVDRRRGRLYVADACNHRIAIYDLDGNLQGYIGRLGTAKGQLRYPYDLAIESDGTLIVCEYGNNRIQLFRPDGSSVGVYGGPGRQLGKLAYPWAVAVNTNGLAFVVDAGNDRIQLWRLR